MGGYGAGLGYQVKAMEFVDVCLQACKGDVGEWSPIEVRCIIAYDQWRAEVQSLEKIREESKGWK